MMDVVISPRSADLRRRLGPTAWMVLEELLLGADADPDNETIACSESVRPLGLKLGLDKDTVARSVQRLIDADLVCRAQPRTAAGAFARASYLIRIPDGLRAVVPEPACTTHRDAPERSDSRSIAVAPRPARPTAIGRPPASSSSQLSLLDG